MRTSLSLAAASLLFSMAAGAQDAATADAAAPLPTIPVGSDQPPPVPATATGDDQQGLAEIIVTAQKREQSLHRSEEHTSELQSLMRISYAVFCLKKKRKHNR